MAQDWILALIAPAFADEGDDILQISLSKSDLVVRGEINSEPVGLVNEADVVKGA